MDRASLLKRLSGATGEPRYAGSAGERQMLDAVRECLPAGVLSRPEGFVAHVYPQTVKILLGLGIVSSGILGIWLPKWGFLLCLVMLIGLIAEGTGRLAFVRAWLPKSPSYNLVIPPQEDWSTGGEAPRGTIILSSPLDVPRWNARALRWMKRPYRALLLSAQILSFLLLMRVLSVQIDSVLVWVYIGCLVVVAILALVGLWARSPTVQEEADVGGLAATLLTQAQLRANPIEGVEVWTVFTGAGSAHQEGMDTFLRLRGERLPEPVFVVSMAGGGAPGLVANASEGPLWPQRQRPTGPSLVERLGWAGLQLPLVDQPQPTDGRAAMLLGYRALSFGAVESVSTPASIQHSADVVELVCRWFGEDLRRVGVDRGAVQALHRSLIVEE